MLGFGLLVRQISYMNVSLIDFVQDMHSMRTISGNIMVSQYHNAWYHVIISMNIVIIIIIS